MAKTLIINETLCFLSNQVDKHDREHIFSILSEFYSLDDLTSAKHLLIAECDKLSLADEISDFKKRRQNSKGDAKLKIARDILDIWAVIDCEKAGETQVLFVAADLTRIPPSGTKSNNSSASSNNEILLPIVKSLQKQVCDIGNLVTRIDKRTGISAGLSQGQIRHSDLSSPSLFSQSPSRTLPWRPYDAEDENHLAFPASVSQSRRLNSNAAIFSPKATGNTVISNAHRHGVSGSNAKRPGVRVPRVSCITAKSDSC